MKAMTEMHAPERNWAGNYTYRAQKLHRPTTIEQVQEIVANAASVHVLGSRHSFNDIADSSELISLENLPADVVVDHEAHTVSLGGGVKYGNLAKTLNEEGVALHTLASLPHISVAGAVATATHGSGVTCGNLGPPGAGLELVTSSGEEIQSEYLFPRRHAMGAIEAMRALADRMRPILQVCEIRRVAADRLWMSMNYEEDSVGFHFTWKREPDAVQEMVAQIEDALTSFEARPHWGKVFHADAAAIAPLYKRHSDFVRLVERLDPRDAVRNAWLKARVLGDK